MIFDLLENHARYDAISPGLAAAFDYLLQTELGSLPLGRMDVQGDLLYALVQEYETRLPEQGKWEAHRRYIDVQYIYSGHERMGFAQIDAMQVGEYLPEKDFLPMTGEGSTVDMFPGTFVVFFPEDGHKPCLAVSRPEMVRKVVLKVAVEGW